jgi:hypothetical protein
VSRRHIRVILVAAGVLFGFAPAAIARPPHKQALAEYFGPYLPKKLHDCRTCHLPDRPGQEEGEKPHNPFGARLDVVRKELRRAGKPLTIESRLDAILQEDSDGDGVSNLLEILSGHFPGDPDDRPNKAEIDEAKLKLAAFLKFRAGYRWRPLETVTRPAVPAVKNAAWVRNPIDAFLAAGHEERGVRPRPEAPKSVLLRRVYLDLTGLPPTPDELHAFLDDNSPDAYERVVDRLLATSRYGERWGRHWMDVWRYSDWAGYGPQIRDSQPHIWRWRDWIVESLNEDKGYDRMILEMLAGDEIAPEDSKLLRATGFLVRNYKLLSREKWMQDVVEHTSMGFLGVTMGCARCHDHMYDPILQKDYYRMRAIFEPHNVRIDRLPGQPDTAKDGIARAFDLNPDAKTLLFIRGDDRTPDKEPLPPGVPAALGGKLYKVEPVKLPRTGYCPDKREFVVCEDRERSAATLAKARVCLHTAEWSAVAALGRVFGDPSSAALVHAPAALKAANGLDLACLDAEAARHRHDALEVVLALEKLEDTGQRDSPEWQRLAKKAQTLQRRAAVAQARRDLTAGKNAPKAKKGGANLAALEKALAKAEAELKLPATTGYAPRVGNAYPQTSTGRRLALAKWIADADNPLTARVAVNHIWLRHFGQALVPSVFDFGRNGRVPTHPALLDWLAAEFMERGWSTKAMHRLIVTSNAYRMDSTPDSANQAVDRDNVYLWRVAPRRLEAEAVRDAIFYVAGKLDLTTGGPDIDYPLGLTVPRRSLYFRHAAEKEMAFLEIFDSAAVSECYERKQSIIPQQALALANSTLTRQQAKVLGRSLSAKHSEPAAFTVAAFETMLTRAPTQAELTECLGFLKEQERRSREHREADPELRARESLVHVLFNHHEFVTIR